MRTCLVLIAVAMTLAGCGVAPTTPSSTAADPALASPRETATIADAADLFMVTVLDEPDGIGSDDLQIDVVSPTGIRRPVATLTDVTEGLAEGTRIATYEPMLVDGHGYLTVVVESFDEALDGDVQSRLIVDLRVPGRPPIAAPGGRAVWGPTGLLAVVGDKVVTIIDPATGDQQAVPTPDGTSVSAYWAADGSGLVATRPGPNEVVIVGIVTLDGRFSAGPRELFSTTGLGRPHGAGGAFVGDAYTDGATESDHALVEQRAGEERPVVWLSSRTPGPDREIFDHTWDAAGTGLWVLLGGDGEVGLHRLTGPQMLDERATFETSRQPVIVGVAPDDSAVVVAIEAKDAAPAELLRIDTSTGAVVKIGVVGDSSFFTGWAASP